MKKQYIIIAIVVGLAAFALYQNSVKSKTASMPNKVEEVMPNIGYKAPDFNLKALDGNTYSLKNMEGKPVIINFWASWCGPCQTEAPELAELYDKYKKDLEIYAVNLTFDDTEEDAKAFVEKYGYHFPVLVDDSPNTASLYQVHPIPTTFFVNRKGIIVDKMVGITDKNSLEDKFKNLISN
ncbi:TlpA family protein disulfide reductase [Paenibacillus alginolyticus]|uniref:TlpA family protein disulfide reductase n=1 Tax=Paenibacillus alginolyticus TaxID=59839 RepID=A0ABT4GBB7_9BACL|nr:TlpA disulfide reductase family protein [Paenibacillus alginolyticus]MCY9693393.1 TlpA family protein disulfide reductase [Paenibacillus alginolyticus]MEC0144652.1 TlpA disulfide reductase family protein [Paenibacillus alginolyticus]